MTKDEETPRPPARPALRDLMASIGYLLLHWGEFERRLGGRPLPPELARVRQLRNALCHGLYAARADPTEEREPSVFCLTLGGEEVGYTWLDLEEAIRTLEGFNGSAGRPG